MQQNKINTIFDYTFFLIGNCFTSNYLEKFDLGQFFLEKSIFELNITKQECPDIVTESVSVEFSNLYNHTKHYNKQQYILHVDFKCLIP